MALFSQRFWIRLGALDSRVVTAQRRQRVASERMLVAQRLVTGEGLEDFLHELRVSSIQARNATTELKHFCAGRNRFQETGKHQIPSEAALLDVAG